MARSTALIVAVLLAGVCGAAAKDWVEIEPNASSLEAAATVVASGVTGTMIDIDVPGFSVEAADGVRGGVTLRVPGGEAVNLPGAPDLPALTYFVAVPAHGGVELEIISSDERSVGRYSIAPAAPRVNEGEPARAAVVDDAVYSSDAFFPRSPVTMGSPAVMRDVRFVPLTVYPVRWNPATGELLATGHLSVRISTSAAGASRNARGSVAVADEATGASEVVGNEVAAYGNASANEKTVSRDWRSEAFEPIYKSFLLNYDQLPAAEVRRGSYLIIAKDTFLAQMTDFVTWKTRRGVETVLVPLSTIGSTPTKQDIKDYIQDAYETWDNPPDYVMLVGDTYTGFEEFPCWYVTLGGPQDPTDLPYSLLEGDDYFPEVLIGRMAIDTTTEATVASLKTISYERGDAATDAWYERALTCAGNYGGDHVTSPRQTSLRVGEMLKHAGYAQIDTVFYKPVTSPVPIKNSINAGVSFVNYRGWGNAAGWEYPQFVVSDVQSLSNGEMLPVMTSIVCGTGNFDSWGSDPCFAEAWIRSGTPGALKGGPAVFAPSHFNTHTKENNYICTGFYQGALFEDLRHMGQAVLRAKMELYRHFPFDTDPGGDIEFYFNIYNIIGDPELYLRTAAPGSFSVTHDASVSLGENMLAIHVTDGSGNAVPGAEVIVWKDGESFEIRELAGGVNITMPLNAETAGAAYVTVVGKNMRPYTGTVSVTQDAQYVGYFSHSIDDDGSGLSDGNGDGVVNPGETIELNVSAKNYGTTIATDVTADLELYLVDLGPDPIFLDNSSSYDDIPGSVVETGVDDFLITFPDGCRDGAEYVFRFTVTAGSSRTEYESIFSVVIGAPVLAYDSVAVSGDGALDPGETATLTVTLANTSYLDATSVSGTLRTPASGLTASDSAGSWGNVAGEGTASNAGNTFTVTAASDVAVGHEFDLVIDLTGDDGLSQFVIVPLTVGTPSAGDPLGPDTYGYYCYDNTDAGYSEAPSYSWVEIDPSYGGSGSDLGLGFEDITDVALPFSFRYYGEDYSTVAVCSNGDVGMGGAPVWEHQPRNARIPSPLGPDAMIAPFWDSLFPADSDTSGGSGKVLTRNMGDGRFVIEWSRVGTGYDNGGVPQTFQLVLYDQDIYSTFTGDGEMLFQYHTIANSDTHNYATVGIENPAQSDGIEYTYFDIYPPSAAPLSSGRAIKFTTDPPDAYESSGVDENAPVVGVVLNGNRPNPFNPNTVVTFTLPQAAEAGLSVYDVAGRKVATLFEGEASAGQHSAAWDGRTDTGTPAATGVYFARLSAMGQERSIKMVLLK